MKRVLMSLRVTVPSPPVASRLRMTLLPPVWGGRLASAVTWTEPDTAHDRRPFSPVPPLPLTLIFLPVRILAASTGSFSSPVTL